MRIRRGLLFWGLLFISMGVIPLLVQTGNLDPGRLGNAWQLWPLVLIGIGIAVLVGRTRWALVGTAVIALTLGTIAGAALAAPKSWFAGVGNCVAGGTATQLQKSGSFADAATVSLDFRCGTLDVTAGGGTDWAIDAAYAGQPPTIEAGNKRLNVRAADGPVGQHDAWTIQLPASQLDEVDLLANAATGQLDLGSATMSELTADLNAGDLRIVAASGGTRSVDVTLNAGRLRLETSRAEMSGSLSVNAGAIDLCVPSDVGLRLDVKDQLTFGTNLASEGLAKSGNVWTREASGGAPTIELSVDGNAASLTLKGEGACR